MNNSETDSKALYQCPTIRWNPSWLSTIAMTTITTTACPLAILLNAIVIFVVIKKKQLRTVNCVLLASLAGADLLIAAVAQPTFIAAGIFRLLEDYEVLCSLILVYLLVMYLLCAIIYHLTLLAWERYVAIKKATKYKVIVTKPRVKICTITSWVLTPISSVPAALYLPGFINKKLFIILNTCFFMVPMTICLGAIIVFYIVIYLETRRRKQMSVNQLPSQSARNAEMERQIAKTTFLLTVTLFVSFAPMFILWFFALLFGSLTDDVLPWAVTFNKLNSLANPILYFYRNRRFRNIALEMLNMRKPSENQISVINLVQDPNPKQAIRTEAKPNSWEPNMFVTKQETSNSQRPKSYPVYPYLPHVMSRKETSSLIPTRFPAVSSIPAATIGGVGMQVDLATFSHSEEDLQKKEHSYMRTEPKSKPFKNKVLGVFKVRKPPENQIATEEVSQGLSNAMQYNHTRAKPNAWEPYVFDESREASNATRPRTALDSLNNGTKRVGSKRVRRKPRSIECDKAEDGSGVLK